MLIERILTVSLVEPLFTLQTTSMTSTKISCKINSSQQVRQPREKCSALTTSTTTLSVERPTSRAKWATPFLLSRMSPTTTRLTHSAAVDVKWLPMKYLALVVPTLDAPSVDRVPLDRADLLPPRPTILNNISTE